MENVWRSTRVEPVGFASTEVEEKASSTNIMTLSAEQPRRIQTPLDPGVYYSNPALDASVPSLDKLKTPASDSGLDSKDELAVDAVPKQTFGVDENVERGNWTGKFDFLLSCLGYAVGLGNVWRFPYMCYRNGGGAFLVPYTIFLVFVGMPCFLLDLSLGQFTSSGPLTCWEFAPLFTGVGYAMTVISGLVTIYYNMIIAYSIYYMFASMASPLPWEGCHNSWNTKNCRDLLEVVNCTLLNGTKAGDGQCFNSNQTVLGLWDEELFTNKTGRTRILPAQEYWNNEVLGLTDGIHDIGACRWKIVLCLLASWVLVFLCMIKGIKSSGKVVYFTALFPYAVLVILFFRGITLEGAGAGIYFYLVPKFDKLTDITVWKDAANQIFFSLSASWGGLITLSSYNRFHNNVIRDTVIVSLGNCGTSVFAGFVIFSFLGHMAHELHTTVDKVADKGMGLAFVIYPEAVTTMPASTLWAILFFIMLLTLGLDSQFTMLETVATSVLDKYTWLRQKKTLVIGFFCLLLFFLGLPMTTGGGPYLLQLMDNYCGGWAILMIGLFECIAIGWIYGRPGFTRSVRFLRDIQAITGKRQSLWWRFTWQYAAPGLILTVLILSWMFYEPAKYGDHYYYPPWADAMGWMMTLSSMIWIPVAIIFLVVRDHEGGTILNRLYLLTLPSYKWGPALPKHRRLVADYLEDPSDFYIDPEKRIRFSEVHNTEPMTGLSTTGPHSNPAFNGDARHLSPQKPLPESVV